MTRETDEAVDVYRVSISPDAWTDPPVIVPSKEFYDDAKRYGVDIIMPGRFSPMRQDITVIYAVDSERSAYAQFLVEFVPGLIDEGDTPAPVVGGRVERAHVARLYMARAVIEGVGHDFDAQHPERNGRLPDQPEGGALVERLSATGEADYLFFRSDYGIDHTTYALFSMSAISPEPSLPIDPDDETLAETAALLGIELV